MEQYDLDNVEFLLNASEDVLEEWSKIVDDDDLDYAKEILTEYYEELGLTYLH